MSHRSNTDTPSLNQLPRLNCGCLPHQQISCRPTPFGPTPSPHFNPGNLGIIPSYRPSPVVIPPSELNVSGKIKNVSIRARHTRVLCTRVCKPCATGERGTRQRMFHSIAGAPQTYFGPGQAHSQRETRGGSLESTTAKCPLKFKI